MRLPDAEEERQGIYRAAIAAILGALGRAEMDDDAAAALWALVHVYLPYRLERPDEVDVEWSEEDATLVQKLDQKWLADIEARGEATGKIEGKREALRTVLQGRFGALPEAVEHRIAAADGDQLDALLSRAATVARPDEL